jgi:hypothetical protein
MKKLLFSVAFVSFLIFTGSLSAQEQPPAQTQPAAQEPAKAPEQQPSPAPAEPATPVPQPAPAPAEAKPAPAPEPVLPPPPPAPPEKGKEEGKKTEEIPAAVSRITGTGTEGKFPLGGLVILDQALGVGTFVEDTYARNPYYAWTLSLRPKYFLTDKISAEARFDLSQELTNSYTTATTKKNEIYFSDTILTFKYNNLFTEPNTGISFSPFIRFGFPTSTDPIYHSGFHNLYLATGLGFDAMKMLGKVSLTYTFRFTKQWNKYTTSAVKYNTNAPVTLARIKGNEELGENMLSTGQGNNSFSFFNSLMGTYLFNDQWSLSLQIAVLNGFRYRASAEQDQYTSPYATSGYGRYDTLYGLIDVSYQAFENVGFSIGIDTRQPPKTEDNKAFRFPFFDFVSEANNYTSYYFDVYANF